MASRLVILACLMALLRPVSELAIESAPGWLEAFHRGDRAALEAAYRHHVRSVVDEAARLLRSADAETVAHEVFYRVLTDARMRESFHGGNVGAWLRIIARRAAIDLLRKRRREDGPVEDDMLTDTPADPTREHEERDARVLVERFRAEVLPARYRALFEVRFLGQLAQREAADKLGMSRSTLAYQEERVRDLLKAFLLERAAPAPTVPA
ncbi:MAG TPA: RNA polymerase sigma factor [Polyangiaceae bacterium]|nr:RNA polymerase sigma factor [Polyangiaceae bacterium]